MSHNCGLCVHLSDRRESNPRVFFKVALFFRAGKESVETLLGIFSKLHFFPSGKGIRGDPPRDFFKVALFFQAGKDPWKTAQTVDCVYHLTLLISIEHS
jgi:hypothetical protein